MTKKRVPHRIFLAEEELPTQYYNIVADLN